MRYIITELLKFASILLFVFVVFGIIASGHKMLALLLCVSAATFIISWMRE